MRFGLKGQECGGKKFPGAVGDEKRRYTEKKFQSVKKKLTESREFNIKSSDLQIG